MDMTSGPVSFVTPVATNSTHFNPVTQAMDSTGLVEVYFSIELISKTANVQVRPAVQYSEDGVGWSGSITAYNARFGAVYTSVVGWTPDQGASQSGVWNTLSPSGLFARFGVIAQNTSTRGRSEGGVVRLRIQSRPVATRTVSGGPKLVGSAGTTSRFAPMTDAVATGQIEAVRPTVFVDQPTANFRARVGYQLSDDGYSWDTPAACPGGTWRASQGYDYGSFATEATAAMEAKRFVRFGAIGETGSGTEREFGFVSIRVDMKGVT